MRPDWASIFRIAEGRIPEVLCSLTEIDSIVTATRSSEAMANGSLWPYRSNAAPVYAPPTYCLTRPLALGGSGRDRHPGVRVQTQVASQPPCDVVAIEASFHRQSPHLRDRSYRAVTKFHPSGAPPDVAGLRETSTAPEC